VNCGTASNHFAHRERMVRCLPVRSASIRAHDGMCVLPPTISTRSTASQVSSLVSTPAAMSVVYDEQTPA